MPTNKATSSTGTRTIYEAADQRNAPQTDESRARRFHQGEHESHKAYDSKDERTISNRIAEQAQSETEPDHKTAETERLHKDPRLPAEWHGNKPSRGAQIDAELKAEEEEELRQKGRI